MPLHRDYHQTWNHFSQKHSISLSGSHLLSIFMKTFKLDAVWILRNSDASLSIARLSFLRLLIDLLAQKWTFPLRELKEVIFITWSQFSLLTQTFNTIWFAIQERKKFPQLKVRIPSIQKDIEQSMPTQYQLPMVHAWAKMLLPTVWIHYSSLS